MGETREQELRRKIRELVAQYYEEIKKPEQEKPYQDGDRIAYASRVYDEKEMLSLTDAMLDFWLTTGRFADQMRSEACTPGKQRFLGKSSCIYGADFAAAWRKTGSAGG